MITHSVDAQVDGFFTRPTDEGISLAVLVMHRGAVVAERYGTKPANAFEPEQAVDAETTLISWSMAKSITHALIGLLVTDGLLDVASPAPVPEWSGTDKQAITILDLLEMRSGLHFIEDYVDDQTSNCIEMLFGGTDPSHAAYAAAQPLEHPPGAVWSYSSGTTNILCRIVGDVLTGASGGDPAIRRQAVERYLAERLFGPAGMTSAIPKFDEAGDFVGSSYVYATARDFARFGELYRHDGVTDSGHGARLLPDGWRDHARTKVAHDPEHGFDYGRHWWMWPQFPGSLSCHGYQGQYTIVVPDKELVVVHLGLTAVDVAPALQRRLSDLVETY
ncbi:MAG: serine hydrolase domain-containing protein [Ilumatobacteraceae bacterium]